MRVMRHRHLERGRRLWPPSSLRLRLALWYLLVLGVVLALFGTLVFLDMRQSLLTGVDNVLKSRAEIVSSQTSIGPGGVRYQGGDTVTAEGETAVYLFDVHGRLVEKIAASPELAPQPGAVGAALRGGDSWATVGGLRLYTTGIHDDRGRLVGAVQVVQSLDEVTAELSQLLALLLLATPALAVVAMAGGVFLAGRALAPIDRITRTARAIGAGNLAGRLGLAPRNDEVGRLAATFDSMLDRLERAFAQQRQFAADASHELRTPLTIIKGDLDVLLRRRRSPDEYEEVVRGVDDEITRLSRLVEDLLTLARADSGQAELAHEFIYLDALVEDVAAGIGRLAEAKGVSVETRVEREVAIVGDPARLRQLALNLLGNAVKYTPAGGHVRVRLTSSAGWASLDVADSGIGIAQEDLPHIFDRFFRTDKARSRAEGGTGLGLAIARWCAEAHGGRIEVRSRPGEGSVFTVQLPLALTWLTMGRAARQAPPRRRQSRVAPPPLLAEQRRPRYPHPAQRWYEPGQCGEQVSRSNGVSQGNAVSRRILVVDDDERLAAVVRDGLTHHGYAVDVTADGAAALAAVRDNPPDLVVLDLMLPGLDGVEVCRRLHTIGGPPVIMLTARDAVAEKIAGLESGADDYLTKPFVLDELVARVRAVLRRHAPRPEAPLRVADLTLDARSRRVWRGDRPIALTAREFDLLEYLMQHAGRVLTHSALLEQVWGYTFEVESNAVKVYVAYLRQKLNAAGETDLIQAVRGVGYVLRA